MAPNAHTPKLASSKIYIAENSLKMTPTSMSIAVVDEQLTLTVIKLKLMT